MRQEIQGVTELPGPRESREPRARQALADGPAQQDQSDKQVTKEMPGQLEGGESMDDQASRVTRALQDLWELLATPGKKE